MDQTVYVLKEIAQTNDDSAFYVSVYKDLIAAKKAMWTLLEQDRHDGYEIDDETEWDVVLIDENCNRKEYEIVPQKVI